MPSTRRPSGDSRAWTEKTLPTHLGAIRAVEAELMARLLDLGYDEEHRFAVRLAIEEALVNAMKHGNRMDPSRQVRLRYCASPECVEISVADEGAGFDPAAVPDPTADENLRKPCGRGIMLMRAYMDEVSYSGSGQEVHMVKYRTP